VKKYIEKPNVYTPRVVEAVQFDNSVESRKAIGELCGHWASLEASVYITSPIGAVRVEPGDYVIRRGESNFGVMNAEAFGTQYEAL
jgi:hypothetical protein